MSGAPQADEQIAVSVLMTGELIQERHRRDTALAIVVIKPGTVAVATNAKAKASEASEKIIVIETRNERVG